MQGRLTQILGTALTNGDLKSTIKALPLYVNDYAKPVVPVIHEHTVVGPGLGAIIAHFMFTACDEGEGVLLGFAKSVAWESVGICAPSVGSEPGCASSLGASSTA